MKTNQVGSTLFKSCSFFSVELFNWMSGFNAKSSRGDVIPPVAGAVNMSRPAHPGL